MKLPNPRSAARQADACPLEQQEQWEDAHPGARASRPHALPYRAAEFPCDGHPATLPARTPWAGLQPCEPARAPSSSKSDGRGPPGSAGVPPACTAPHHRIVPLSFPDRWAPGHPAGENAMGRAAALQAGAVSPRAARAMGKGPPGSAGARMHSPIVPLFPCSPACTADGRMPTRERGYRAAQFPCDRAPSHPAGEKGPWAGLPGRDAAASRRGAPPRAARVMGGCPPGSAGVPPACTAVSCR